MTPLEKFERLGLTATTLKAIAKKGFEEPTPIQKKCIPLVLKHRKDVVGQAQTGTGKTAAFGLPVIEIVDPSDREVQALILTPTRELAIQVAEELNSLKTSSKLSIAPIYGGQNFGLQLRRLKEGVQIVVGTPGRVLDHLNRRTLKLDSLAFFVLDEADEMLNMGFIEEVEKILESTPDEKRMLLFSATMPSRIVNLGKKYMGDYELVKIAGEQITVEQTDQIYFEVAERDKFESLCRIIDVAADFYGLVFCRTKIDVDTVANKLIARGYDAEGIHGDLSQVQRERVFKKFKSRRITILVATDVAARGIDVSDLTHVINYALPQSPDNYVHRIGRTGRAGKQGTAVTFITPYEYRKFMFITGGRKTSVRKETVPEIRHVIDVKKKRIIADLDQIIADSKHEDFVRFASDLTKDHDPNEVIAALLKYSFEEELDQGSYSAIQQFSGQRSADRRVVDKQGINRLFIAMGKKDGMTESKLVSYITKKAGVKPRLIRDVKVFEIFSLVSVPYVEAEIIIKAFKDLKRGYKPIVRRDRKKQSRKKRYKKKY